MPVLTCKQWTAGLLLFAPLESAMILWRIPAAPLAWVCLLWLLVLLVLAVCQERRRALYANLAAVLFAVALVEALLYVTGPANPYLLPSGVRFAGDLARPNYFIQMPTAGLGYQPRPGMSIRAVKLSGSHQIYNVRYSVGEDGLRIRPATTQAARACLLMFGDSVAWGEGVGDQETAAWQIGALSQGTVHVVNFAFTGYSAHQMLWQVSSGIVARLSGCDPRQPVLAVYQTLPNNVARVAGLRGWDQYGPRYVLGSDARLRYAGSFALGDYALHDRWFIPAAWAQPLEHVNLYTRILGKDRRVDDFDRKRFVAVVEAAARGMRASYPRLTFLVVVWPEPPQSETDPASDTAKLIRSLREQDLRVLSATDIVPEYRGNPAATGIPGDGHPTAAVHLRIARYFLQREQVMLAQRNSD